MKKFILLLFLLGISSCGSDSSPSAQNAAPNPTAGPVATSFTHIQIYENARALKTKGFGVSPLTVGIATEVTWTNNDTIVHRIVANDQSFDSGDLEPGSSYSVIITQVGTYSYYCSDDSEIAAVIKVIDPSTSSN